MTLWCIPPVRTFTTELTKVSSHNNLGVPIISGVRTTCFINQCKVDLETVESFYKFLMSGTFAL